MEKDKSYLISLLRKEIESLQKEIAELRDENRRLKESNKQLEREKNLLFLELNKIYSSDFWRAAKIYYTLRDKTFLKNIYNFLRRIKRGEFSKGQFNLNKNKSWISKGKDVLASRKFNNKYDVIFFSIINWDFRYQRPQHIASRFAKRGHRVFYISIDLEANDRYLIRKIDDNIFEVKLPFNNKTTIYGAELENGIDKIKRALDSLFEDYRIKESVAFVEFPNWLPAVKHLKEYWKSRVVFDCLDDFSGFSNISSEVENKEKKLIELADLCIASSEKLFKKVLERNPNTILVKNAAEFEHFNNLPSNDLLEGLKKPIIGYYGAIAEWFDIEAVEQLAASKPDWNIVLIGHTFGADVDRLKRFENVHLLGEKPYKELPKYLYWFDVCIIPFKINELTLSTNPVKFYEYMSSGKPVVASKLPELEPYRDYVYFYESKEDFVQKVEKALEEDSDEKRKKRIALAKENTWDSRFEDIYVSIKKTFPLTSIVIVTYNNLNYTKLCIDSILNKTAYPNYEIIVVDNASSDGTREYLESLREKYSNIKLILNKENLGFAAANNQGIREAKGDYIIFLNNDTVVTRGWILGLTKYLEDKSVGLVGPVTNSIGNEAKINVDYTSLEDMDEFAERYTSSHRWEAFEIPVLAFFCVATRRDVIEKVGFLDESFGVGMFEDDDYCLRVKRAGYKLLCAEDVFIHHFGSATFNKLEDEKYRKIFEENKRKFEEKWNIKWQPHRYRPGVK